MAQNIVYFGEHSCALEKYMYFEVVQWRYSVNVN